MRVPVPSEEFSQALGQSPEVVEVPRSSTTNKSPEIKNVTSKITQVLASAYN